MPDHIFCRRVQRYELECLEIRHPFFQADIVLQGAQLIYFRPTQHSESWLWLSDQACYKKGKSLRGGIPICWPWFGNAGKNPVPVQRHISTIDRANDHGFARNEQFMLESIMEDCHSVVVTLSLTAKNRKDWQGAARLTAQFTLSKNACELVLSTTNLDDCTLHFSQALHSYFPTSDIEQTQVYGLEGSLYADALIEDENGWKRKQQVGAVAFNQETDRVYFPSRQRIRLQTPKQIYNLKSQCSQSCVVWNPWIKKSERLSQFSNQAYQQMLCIETANVLEDSLALEPGQSLSINLKLTAD